MPTWDVAVAPTPVSIEQVRAQFPALSSGFAFFENAGGSQVPVQVLDRMRDLMTDGYVQTHAGYPASDRVDEVVTKARKTANVLMNGEKSGLTVIGPSTTNLLHRLSDSIAHTIRPGDDIVVAVDNHEANIGPWVKLERAGAKLKWWRVDNETGDYSYEEFQRLLTDRTKIVAVAHTSNLLGDILDVKRVVESAHAVGARVVVDGVAFAPHRAIDVEVLGADFYALSLYKVFGPHIALLFGRHEAWAEVEGPNHFFFSKSEMPVKFELGCQPYESLAGLLGVADYLGFLAGSESGDLERAGVQAAFRTIAALERTVQDRIGGYLSSHPRIRLVGPRTSDQSARQPTFSFLHKSKRSDEVVSTVNSVDLGVRYGHMYAARLCEALGAPPETGFVRVSAVHYNTADESDRLIRALDRAL